MEIASLKSNFEIRLQPVKRLSMKEAFRRSLRVAEQIGISRVAEIGGFVGEGIHVCQATRPDILQHFGVGMNTGAQGKGYSFEQAHISAVMEAAEAFAAEPRALNLVRDSYSTLRKWHPTANPNHFLNRPGLSRSLEAELSEEPLMWTRALHVQSGREVLVPAEPVFLFLLPRTYETRAFFSTTSIGLGAGFDTYQSSVKSVLEAIEYYYKANIDLGEVDMIEVAADGFVSALQMRLPKKFQQLYDTHFVQVRIRGAKENLPYIICGMGNHQRMYVGTGIGITIEEALERAHLEAFQSWATTVSGSRENSGRLASSEVEQESDADTDIPIRRGQLKRLLLRPRKGETELRFLIRFLKLNGFNDLYLINLSRADFEFSVTKALIPGLPTVELPGPKRPSDFDHNYVLARRFIEGGGVS